MDAILDLTDPTDRDDYQRLLLFVAYLKDRGIASHVTVIIARDVYRRYDGSPAADATVIFNQAFDDLRQIDTTLDLAGAITILGEIALGLPEATTALSAASGAAPTEPLVSFNLRRVARAAASLELLWNYTVPLPGSILPLDARPRREFVDRCLQIFHDVTRETVAKQMPATGDAPTGDAQEQ